MKVDKSKLSAFGRYFNGIETGQGSFIISLFKTFIKGDTANREKIIQAFPDYFNELDIHLSYPVSLQFNDPPTDGMDDVIVYSHGILSCSVCVKGDMSIDEIELKVNIINPTGLSSSWQISKDKNFTGGQTNPCTCEDHSDRKHYLMEC